MLNMGSILSLPDYFTSASDPMPGAHILPDHCHIHLIDSHRPYNLDNLFATSTINDRLHVWDDGEIEERLGKQEKAYTALEFLDEEISDDESEDEESQSEEDDGEEEEGGQPRKRRRKEGQGRKRLAPNVIAGHRKVLQRYYNRGAEYGWSIAGMMYMLMEKLGRGSNESLWMAILGLTSQYTSSQLPHGLYNDLSKAFASDVHALNPPPSNKTSYVPDDGRIRVVEKELRFTLYRHWSLEASLYHSSYVAGKMGIWKEQGIFKLRNFMAKMGLSLSQCRQAFEHMNLDLRQSLLSRIEAIAPEYELTECIYRSFVRSYGLRCPAMGAADIVEGLDALLCAAHGVRIEVDAPGLAFGGAASSIGDAQGAYLAAMGGQMPGSDMFNSKRLWQLTKASTKRSAASDKENVAPLGAQQEEDGTIKTAPSKQEEGEEENWKLNFFAAFRALDTKRSENLNLLRASLNLSKSLHETVVRTGVQIIEKQLIRTLKSFRVVVLKDDVKLFHNTQVLTRLASWLVDALRDLVQYTYAHKRSKKKTNAKGEEVEDHGPDSLPFIIAALNEKEDVYTVVGINASMHYGDVLRNNFGYKFHQAVQDSNTRSKHDHFATSDVEIRREDLAQFISTLNDIL
jgi:cell division control protein 45